MALAISSRRPGSITDIDHDGDLDFLATKTNERRDRLTWFENTSNGSLQFTEHPFETEVDAGEVIRFLDIDSDGDLDIQTRNSWLLDVDGTGMFTEVSFDGCLCGIPFDFDGDGDLDSLSSHVFGVTLHENRLFDSPQFGDANRDGAFDSADLIEVFQKGKYEDGIENNSTFEDGDWNGDGDFDTSDLVLAFQLGTFISEEPTGGE